MQVFCDLADQYKELMDFTAVYIAEAHPLEFKGINQATSCSERMQVYPFISIYIHGYDRLQCFMY